jgi:DNA-binding response OmpR family regulator
VPASQETSTGTAANILLVEEYGALAAAITSALKKFAPQHRTRTVRSLGEAEAAAAETRPELFIFDFERPESTAVEILNRISTAYPESQALVLTPGSARPMASERFGRNGIRFVEKPFELSEFGAAVQALLRPPTNAPSAKDLKIAKPARPLVEEQKPVTTPPKNGKKIVVIDDTEMLSILVEDVLSLAEPTLQITTASTGTEGASKVASILPDLVLLDYSLPDLRGDQVCERLLENETTARIPVVMMSGHVSEMMATADRYPNVVATIAKPFMSAELVTLVKETLTKGSLPPGVLSRRSAAKADRETPPLASPPAEKPAKPVPQKVEVTSTRTAKEPVKVIVTSPKPIPLPPITLAPASSIELVQPQPRIVTPTVSPRIISPANHLPIESKQVSRSTPPVRLASPNATVVLGLGMEVISVQFGSRFKVKTIRVRPSPTTLSLTQISPPFDAEHRWGSGFALGTVDLDPSGRIRTMRVLPMRRPAGSIRTRNGFDINDVMLLNGNGSGSIQLTAGASTPMTIQMVTRVKVVEVELSERFEVAQLVLHLEGSRVRAALDPSTGSGYSTEFETARVRLDSAAHIAELVLRLVAD